MIEGMAEKAGSSGKPLKVLAARSIGTLLALLVAAAPAAPDAPAAQAAADSHLLTTAVGNEIRVAIEAGASAGRLEAGGDPLYALRELALFYEQRGFDPAWTKDGDLLPVTEPGVRTIAGATVEGLDPADYHLPAIRRLLSGIHGALDRGTPPTPARLAELDLLLTDGCLLYASHLAAGKTDPATILPEWNATRRDLDAGRFLARALAGGAVEAAFDALEPPYDAYRLLKGALARQRRLAARPSWPEVPAGPAIEPGASSERVPLLRQRLAASGDLPPRPLPPAPEIYDPALEEAVRRFQARHGLDADGVVGERTLAALAVPPERRVEQLLVNLERWRWLPADLGARHLEVNIADFELRAVEWERTVFESRVIVGKSYTRTPEFSARLTYIVLNPYWNIPHKIASREILPQVQEDPGYLSREGIRVFESPEAGAAEVDPATVHWADLTPASFPFFLRQDPGPKNSLGRIKLMFPNPYDVYLHDTPQKGLFERSRRAFSHGCIRVEKPFALAAYLLRDDPRWSEEALRAAVDTGEQRTVLLPVPVPIHILYWTAWVDEEGVLELRDDLYGRDRAVLAALRRPPPQR